EFGVGPGAGGGSGVAPPTRASRPLGSPILRRAASAAQPNRHEDRAPYAPIASAAPACRVEIARLTRVAWVSRKNNAQAYEADDTAGDSRELRPFAHRC